MQLERVKSGDVYPDAKNPRADFGDIDALAQSFAGTAGEPLTPPIVRRDGGIFWLVDGERRFRAMQSIGTAEFTALVCDDLDEANAALAMLATDDKKQLDDIERSRGVQQALALGVDPDVAAKAARIDREALYKVQAGRQFAADAAEDMSLDRLQWLGEHSDYAEEQLDAIRDAKESEWRKMASGYESEQGRRDVVSAKIAELTEAGHKAVDGGIGYRADSTAKPEGLKWQNGVHEPQCDDCVCVVYCPIYDKTRAYVDVYCANDHADEETQEEREEEEARVAAAQADFALWDSEQERRETWLSEQLATNAGHLNGLMEWLVMQAADIELEAGETWFEAVTRWAYGKAQSRFYSSWDGTPRMDTNESAAAYLEFMRRLMLAGYQPGAEEQQRMSDVEALANSGEDEVE